VVKFYTLLYIINNAKVNKFFASHTKILISIKTKQTTLLIDIHIDIITTYSSAIRAAFALKVSLITIKIST
jgi:hypothetical protein